MGHGSSVGWHQGLPQHPTVAPCSCERSRKIKMKEFKTTLLFQSRHPFPCFFSAEFPSPLSSNSVCLPSLWWPFTVLPIISLLSTSVGSVCCSAEELVMPDSPPYCCILIPHFWAFSCFRAACRRTQTPIKCPSLELYLLLATVISKNNKKWTNM